jgi:hypothetical protein
VKNKYYTRGRYVFQVEKYNETVGKHCFLGFIFAPNKTDAECQLAEFNIPRARINGVPFVRNIGLESRLKKVLRRYNNGIKD